MDMVLGLDTTHGGEGGGAERLGGGSLAPRPSGIWPPGECGPMLGELVALEVVGQGGALRVQRSGSRALWGPPGRSGVHPGRALTPPLPPGP